MVSHSKQMKKRHQITAVIYDRKGRVLSIGQNSYVKTHPVQAHYAVQAGLPHKQFLHAEIAAIIKCRELELAHRIFVSRWDKQGNPCLSKPCPVCMTAIAATNIKFIEHT